MNNNWTQKGIDIYGEAMNDYSGWSVSLSSDGLTLAIGAINNDGNGDNSGHVKVYEWVNNLWTPKGITIYGDGSNDQSGWSVSLSSDGSIIAIGAVNNDENGNNSGHIKVYKWTDNSSWIQRGSNINGEYINDHSGYSVSLSSDGSIIAIGAIDNDGNGDKSGHVRVYKWTNNNLWEKRGIDINGEASGDASGWSISLSSDGSILAIGAIKNNKNGNINYDNSGHVRVYEWVNNSSWEKKGNDIDGDDMGDQGGYSVSLSSDGSILAIGYPYDDNNSYDNGLVRIYKWSTSLILWEQKGIDIVGPSNGFIGRYVSLSSDGSILAISGSIYTSVYEWNNDSVNYIQTGIINIPGGYPVNLSSNGDIIAVGYPYNDDPDNDDPNNDTGGYRSGLVKVYELYSATTETTDAEAESGVICFLKGTMIKTDRLGNVAIENLKPGTLINGSKVINVFSTKAHKDVVKLSKGSLAHNKPNKDLYVTESHMIVHPKTNNLSFAKDYINDDSITLYNSNKINELYHILFKRWILISANNVKCESLCPINNKSILHLKEKTKLLSEKEYTKLVKRHFSFNYDNVKHINNNIYF